jgi:hypothetical protein
MGINININVAPLNIFQGATEAMENADEKPSGVIAQDTNEQKEESGSLLKNIFFHPKGIAQRSDFGHRFYTPDEIQHMDKEKLEDDEKQKARANAAAKAAATGVDAVNNLLPTNEGAAISGAAGTVISAVSDKLTDRTEQGPPKPEKGAPDEPGQTVTRSKPNEDEHPTTPDPAKDEKDRSGLKLNPDFVGPFENIDPDSLTKKGKPAGVEPSKTRATGPVKIKIDKAPARKDAVLTRESDPAGDALERRKLLQTKRMERIW